MTEKTRQKIIAIIHNNPGNDAIELRKLGIAAIHHRALRELEKEGVIEFRSVNGKVGWFHKEK